MKFLLIVALTALTAACGCVVRELNIRSDPPGATVYINGREEGKTPFKKNFDFYGSRELTLRMDGYLAKTEIVTPAVPWYEFFPIDLVSELLLPFYIHDRHEYSFTLEPLLERPPKDLLKRAQKVRAEKH